MMTDCRCWLQQLAASKLWLCHFNQDIFPPNTMAYDMHSLRIVNLLKLTILLFGDGFSVVTRQCVDISLAAENETTISHWRKKRERQSS